MLSNKDVEAAERYFVAAQEAHLNGVDEVCRGLITAGIVSYARPFSGNADHEHATPHPPFSLRLLTEEERNLHQRVLELRNKAIAHSDVEYNAIEVTAHASNGFVFSASHYEPLDEVVSLEQLRLLARVAKDQFTAAAFQASRAIAADNSGAR